MLNVNLRFILRNSAGADATVQSPYGYFGGHSDEKAGINISTTEDWIYAWRKCQVEQ